MVVRTVTRNSKRTVEVEATITDSVALGDGELNELADLCADQYAAGSLSKQADQWVLVARASVSGELAGFMFSSLERIGGTPAMLLGLSYVVDGDATGSVLSALMAESYHKALMAFPDEDVVVAFLAQDPTAYCALDGLVGVCPWPGERIGGEERAWGRRLAKRYEVDQFNDRTMQGVVDGPVHGVHRLGGALCDEASMTELTAVFDGVGGDGETSTVQILWGWMLAEELERYR